MICIGKTLNYYTVSLNSYPIPRGNNLTKLNYYPVVWGNDLTKRCNNLTFSARRGFIQHSAKFLPRLPRGNNCTFPSRASVIMCIPLQYRAEFLPRVPTTG